MWSPSRAAAALFGCVVVETACGPAWPHLGLPLLCWIALRRGPATGFKAGFLLGVLLDLSGPDRFGAFTVIYAAGGFACGTLRGKVFPGSVVTQTLVPGLLYAGILAAWVLGPMQAPDATAAELFWGLARRPAFPFTVLSSPAVFFLADRVLAPAAERPGERRR